MKQYQLLNNRNIIVMSGKDRFSFLQGLVTNDVNKLKSADNMIYSLMLTPQGKFMYDFFLVSYGEQILIDHESQFTSEILAKLSLYKLRSDVQLVDGRGEYNIAFVSFSTEYGFKDPRHEDLCFRGYVLKTRWHDFMQQNQLEEVSDQYEKIIYDHAIPEPHRDMVQGKSFPIEYAMDEFNAISFTKGCYLGQENISRTKYRGTIRKRIYKFISDIEIQNIEIGAEIYAGDTKIGTYCSSWHNLGKALLRIEEFENCGTRTLQLGEYKIKVV